MESFKVPESSFIDDEATKQAKWFKDNMMLAYMLSFLYLVAVFLGRKWMRYRKPYSLRRALTIWNAGLSLFSIMAFVRVTPLLLKKISAGGFSSSVCSHASNQETAYWMMLFVFSKVVEFGDTAFIVLRKSPLIFLHYYHHVVACTYIWYIASVSLTDSTLHWFVWLNSGVHSIMYSYYFIVSTGIRLPTTVSKSITLLQLLQFCIALVCINIAWWFISNDYPCNTTKSINYLGNLSYSSILILFSNFFYKRYLIKK